MYHHSSCIFRTQGIYTNGIIRCRNCDFRFRFRRLRCPYMALRYPHQQNAYDMGQDRRWEIRNTIPILRSTLLQHLPFPTIREEKKKQIEEAAENILVTRAFYPEKTLAELYDPYKMPEDLREAHATLDDIVDSCYPGYPFANDEARLECLFKLYEKITKKKD